MTSISRDDWLKALNEAGLPDTTEDDQGAVTVQEFADMFSVGRRTADSRLKRMVELGKATSTHKWATNNYGRRLHLIAYRLTP